MTVFLAKDGGRIALFVRAEGAGGTVGDAVLEVPPGGSAFGRTRDEWAALDPGPYEVG